MTDTFQISEHEEGKLDSSWFPENSEHVDKLKRLPIQVIIGNPPYSVGQKSANDNAQNQSYEHLDARITETYVAQSEAGLNKSTYDMYVKAFRWASDKLSQNKEGGVIGFISNGAWLDGNANDGFRKCLEKEFSKIYVLNLRGNQRTSGELSRKEGGKIFGSGSRTPISITILVKKPNQLPNEKATIFYHDIGDYLSTDQKLALVKKFKSIQGKNLDWTILSPNQHGDWISMRNEGFKELIPLAPDKKFAVNSHSMYSTYAIGIATNRDAWVYNFSKIHLNNNVSNMIFFYNQQVKEYKGAINKNPKIKVEDFIDKDDTKISWTRGLRNRVVKNQSIAADSEVVTSLYRPFCKQLLYFSNELIESMGLSPRLFPTIEMQNMMICISCVSQSKGLSALITNSIADLHFIGDTQLFPLYWYEESKTRQLSLFDENPESEYIRHDGISNWILNEVRTRLKLKSIDKEMIFYYIYGFLHSPEYRTMFEADLKKSLPRIPIIEDVDAFRDFYQAGKALAKLHLNYECVAAYDGLEIVDTYHGKNQYEHYAVNPKMKFPKKDQKDTIIYNDYITIRNIPAEAYDYVVNGKSAIEWLMERYAVTVDKKSGIRNDPNDWSREHENPSYIFDLVCSIVNVSIKTMQIVGKLPKLSFNGAEVSIDVAGRMSEISDSTKRELAIATEDNTLYLQVKHDDFYHIVVEERKDLVRTITESTASRYLAVNEQGTPLYNKQNVEEGKRYYLNDYNGGKFPYVAREFRYLKLVNGNASALIAINRINFKAENIKGNLAEWRVQLTLGEIIKVENYIIK